ncbi:pentapeptide repeat-containing protein [Micromonospora sp. NPDC047812]|uniref:pentapeptide repeat-containing protein n=1 Tax=Micromonospora sp. NPDC047812 TaxID=3155742 RepID=UPI003456507A
MTVEEAGAEACRVAVRQLTAAAGAQREGALRRLAELGSAGPALRQKTADAICAYLRTPPASDGADAEARRTVLRALAGLLRPADGADEGAMSSWPDVSVDLSGATLVDVDLAGRVLAGARFTDTRFFGPTSFVDARFVGDAVFARAVFHGAASFDGTRFAADAVFGRTRFRGPATFERVGFAGLAWFGRGEEELWEDDPAWDAIEEVDPAPWDEPNEDDPDWPVAVLMGDYQSWEEGGDGARFVGVASFRQACFDGPAWFWKARFGADATFRDARFGGPVHLDQTAVDLAGARWTGAAEDEPVCWPLGWALQPGPDGTSRLAPDRSVAPYARQLADPDPEVRRAGLRALGELGDARLELRQRVIDTVCAYLRVPLAFDVTGTLTPARAGEVQLRRDAQRLLAERLRPLPATPDGPGPRHWPDAHLSLCGATLLDLDLSGCRIGHADFTGAQFHGVTRFDDSTFDGAAFRLGGSEGRASFHGDASFAGARLDRWRGARDVLGGVVFHAGVVLDDDSAAAPVEESLSADGTGPPMAAG